MAAAEFLIRAGITKESFSECSRTLITDAQAVLQDKLLYSRPALDLSSLTDDTNDFYTSFVERESFGHSHASQTLARNIVKGPVVLRLHPAKSPTARTWRYLWNTCYSSSCSRGASQIKAYVFRPSSFLMIFFQVPGENHMRLEKTADFALLRSP